MRERKKYFGMEQGDRRAVTRRGRREFEILRRRSYKMIFDKVTKDKEKRKISPKEGVKRDLTIDLKEREVEVGDGFDVEFAD